MVIQARKGIMVIEREDGILEIVNLPGSRLEILGMLMMGIDHMTHINYDD